MMDVEIVSCYEMLLRMLLFIWLSPFSLRLEPENHLNKKTFWCLSLRSVAVGASKKQVNIICPKKREKKLDPPNAQQGLSEKKTIQEETSFSNQQMINGLKTEYETPQRNPKDRRVGRRS